MGALPATVAALLYLSIATISRAAPGDRIITVVNLCNQTVRVGHTGGACVTSNTTRYPRTGCPDGQTLNSANRQCYWDIPLPEGGRPALDVQSNSNITLRLTAPVQNCTIKQARATARLTVKWSGNIWGATGCDVGQKVCETALCFDGNTTNNGYCPTYRGPVGPVTLAEFTMLPEGPDTYDVSVINGANIPVEMKASVTNITKSAAGADKTGVSAYYWCGNPGGATARNRNLSDCTWSFALFNISGFGDRSTFLSLVAKKSNGNANCSRDSDCAANEVCGTLEQLNDMSGGPQSDVFPGRCGKLIGLWNAYGLCTWASGSQSAFPNNDAPFRCNISTNQTTASSLAKFGNLYLCNGLYSASGYGVNSPTVCGCPTWGNESINAPATDTCKATNNVWERYALPWTEWMKRACPTAYVFPFDDASSTFQCQNMDPTFNNENTQNYTITFCPNGQEIKRIVPEIESSGSRKGVEFSIFIVLAALAVQIMLLGN